VVAGGDAIIAPGVTRRLVAQFASESRPDPKLRELSEITGREREVLKLVGLGLSNAEIAAASPRTRPACSIPKAASRQSVAGRATPFSHSASAWHVYGRPGQGDLRASRRIAQVRIERVGERLVQVAQDDAHQQVHLAWPGPEALDR
jgi:hypothetical protein